MSKREHITQPQSDFTAKYAYIILGIILVAVTLLRIRLLDFPLERDEGGFAYMAKQILQGIPPYTQAYDFKPPGLYLMYAVWLLLFGHTATGIHMGLLFVNLGSIVALFFITRKLIHTNAALISALVFGILSLSPSLLGFAAHATHLVVFWMLLGYLALLVGLQKEQFLYIFLSGIAFGLSVLMKQPGVFFILFALVISFIAPSSSGFQRSLSLKRTSVLIAGILVPLSLAVIWLISTGAFEQFLFWNVTYGLEFGSRIPVSDAFTHVMNIMPGLTNGFGGIWLLSAAGVALLVTSSARPYRIHIIAFIICSVMAVSIGFQFRSHYFIMLVPALALCSGIVVFWVWQKIATISKSALLRSIPAVVLICMVGFGMFTLKAYFFADSPQSLSRSIYFPNPFSESETIAQFIRSRTGDTDKVAIVGSEPQITFLSGRTSASKYLFTYFFMEPHANSKAMEQEMEKDIEQSKPKILVFVNHPISWSPRPESDLSIFDWTNNYIKQHYEIAGLVDMISPFRIIYKWGDEIRTYSRAPNANILIFERRR